MKRTRTDSISGIRVHSRTIRLLVMASIAMLGALTACGGEGDDGSSQDQGIQNGKATLARPEVGYLSLAGDTCTGTLISPNVVLTAAHCIPSHPCWNGGAEFEISAGTDPSHPVMLVAEYGFWNQGANSDADRCWQARVNLPSGEATGDIGLMELQSPLQFTSGPSLPTAPVPGYSPAPLVAPGATVHGRLTEAEGKAVYYGYGANAGGFFGSGIKRVADAASTNTHPLPGDSGGPFIGADGLVTGVISMGNLVMSNYKVAHVLDNVVGGTGTYLDAINAKLDEWNPPIPLPAPSGMSWVAVNGGTPPSDAVMSDPVAKVIVCRGKFARGTHPGKVVNNLCNISWGGAEITLQQYEVLRGTGAQWMSASYVASQSDHVTFNIVPGGEEYGMVKHDLCRAEYGGLSNPGKLVGTKCDISWGGHEVAVATFDLLVAP